MAESKSDSAFLKQMPRRWKKSAAVLAAFSVAGGLVLTGCSGNSELNFVPPDAATSGGNYVGTSDYTSAPETTANVATPASPAHTDNPDYVPTPPVMQDLELRLHSGGSGSAVYIVHLTEAEALGIVRYRLEAAGLQFGATPPAYTVGEDGWRGVISLDLYDQVRNVAIAVMDWQSSFPSFSMTGEGLAREVAQEFESQTDSAIGVFYTRGHFAAEARDENWNELPPPTASAVATASAAARPELEASLHAQVDAFIAILRESGVL
jgi:hypothetical protein